MIQAQLADYASLLAIKSLVQAANIAVVYMDRVNDPDVGIFRIMATVREFNIGVSIDLATKPTNFNTDFPLALNCLSVGMT